jgi:integrase
MPSVWIERRRRTGLAGGFSYRVEYRLGGRESRSRYAGSFPTKREALARKAWVAGELAALRVPDLSALAEPTVSPTLRAIAERWQASRVDVRESTTVQHRTALNRVLPVLGARPVDGLMPADVADLVAALVQDGKARESIRKSVTALAMVLDFAGVSPNPARDRVQVRLPREEPEEPEPPSAEHVEAVAWLLPSAYRLGLLVLDATGARVGELEAARVGDLDENRQAWLVRAAVSKTRKARWIELPDELYAAVLDRLPPREDRDPAAPLFPGVTADRLRMAIGRACRDAGVPHFSPHALRHRRISLLHRQGRSWAEIGELVGQRSRIVTADRYTHALVDYRELDRAKVLGGARAVPPSVPPSEAEMASVAGAF